MHRLRSEQGDYADVPVRTPGRLQDVLRQDHPVGRHGEEIASQVNKKLEKLLLISAQDDSDTNIIAFFQVFK